MDDIRYLVDFDSEALEREFHDVVIIGSGIAGVYTALEIPEKYKVAILTKENINISNSVLAQGGIAVPLDKEDSLSGTPYLQAQAFAMRTAYGCWLLRPKKI